MVDRHNQSVIRRIIVDAIVCHSSASEQRQKCYKMLEMAFQQNSNLVSQDKKLVSELNLKSDISISTLPLLARLVYCSDPCQKTTNMVKLLLKYGADPNEKFKDMELDYKLPDDKSPKEITSLQLVESKLANIEQKKYKSQKDDKYKEYLEQLKTLLNNHKPRTSSTGDGAIMA